MLSPITALCVAGVTETDNAPAKNVNRSGDAGDYSCHATNVVGTSSSPQSRLAVTGGKLNIYIFVLFLYSIFCNLFLAYSSWCNRN
jgi:hypothetical protein